MKYFMSILPMKSIVTVVFVISIGLTTSVAQSTKIGTQTWTNKNLDVCTFRNGDTIPEARTGVDWKVACLFREPVWCYYQTDGVTETGYGRLYNWYAVNDPRGLAPVGWHIPTLDEWVTLSDFLGTKRASTKLRTEEGWKSEPGTNTTGFSAKAGGNRGEAFGQFFGLGSFGYWWSSTSVSSTEAGAASLSSRLDFLATAGSHNKMEGLSVRCVEGESGIKNIVYSPQVFLDSIVGTVTRIGNLDIAECDFPEGLILSVAKKACAKLGTGWRMPTKAELEVMYNNRVKVGGFINTYYWHFEQAVGWGFVNFLDHSNAGPGNLNTSTARVRAVRTVQ